MDFDFDKMVKFCGEVTEMVAGAREGVILGIRLDISSEALTVRLASRALFHVNRAKFWGEQARLTREKLDEAGRIVTGSPVAEAEGREKHHQDKAAQFSFMADHIIPNRIYRLRDHHVHTYELDKRGE